MEVQLLVKNLLLISLIATLVGCHGNPSKPSEVTQTDAIFVKALYSAPVTLDPILMNDTASLVVSNLLFDGLLKFSPYMELQSALAEKWDTSDDGKTLKFKLRSNIYFHNGEPIKASDVVASLTRAVSKDSTIFKYYDCIEGADQFHTGKTRSVKGLVAIDEKTVAITLKYPFPPFLSVLAGGTAKVLPATLVEKKDFFNAPIGSGPYVFESKVKSGQQTDLSLSRFDRYYGKNTISKIVLRAVDEKIAIDQAVRGEIHDLANYPLTGSEPIFKVGKTVDSPAAWTWIIGLNTRLAPFKDQKTRTAFKNSVDVEGFRKAFYPDAIPAFGYVPPGLPGHRSKAQVSESIPTKASTEKIKIAFPKELAKEKEMRQFLQDSLRKHGWNVEFVATDWQSLMKGYADKTLQGFVVAMNIDYPDTEFLVRNFESNNPDNFSGIKDPNIDLLIRKARTTTDRIEREKVYLNLVELIDKSAVSVNLFHPRSHYWINKCVQGFEPNLLSDVYIDYANVSFLPGCDLKAQGAM